MMYKPLYGNVLVEEEKLQDSPIEIPQDPDLPLQGIVKEIGNGDLGPNNSRQPMEVRPESRVLFRPSDAILISKDPNLWTLNQHDIVVIVEDDYE